MFIPVPIRDCRTAVTAALATVQAKIAEDRKLHRDNAFNQLHDGAVHNGLDVTPARRKEMEEMVERDIEHMMERHPGHDTVKVFENHLAMLTYVEAGGEENYVVLDDQDFHMLAAHLPVRPPVDPYL